MRFFHSNLFLILLLLIASNVLAQKKFQRVIGDANVNDVSFVLPTDDCGYLIIGYHNINGIQGIGFTKTDEFGQTLSAKLYHTNVNTYPVKSLKLTDGFLVLSRIRHVVGTDNDILIMKINFSGDLIWTKKYKGDKDDLPRNIIQTGVNEFAILGATNSWDPMSGEYMMLLFKINESGDLIWSNIYMNLPGSIDLVEFSNNDLLIVGRTSNAPGVLLLKTASNGNPKWAKSLTLQPTNNSLSELSASSVELTGTDSLIILGNLTTSFFVIKTDSSANIYFSKLYQSNMGGSNLFLTETKNMVISGLYGWYSPDTDPAVTMLTSEGSPVWSKRYTLLGTNGFLQGPSSTFDGGFIFGASGWGYFGSSLSDLCLIKMDENGSSHCSEQDLTFTIKDSMPHVSTLTRPGVNAFDLQVETVSYNSIDLTLQDTLICMDNTSTNCSATSVLTKKESSFKKVEVYPNPIVKQFTLKSKNEPFKDISIFNFEGKTIPFSSTSIDDTTVQIEFNGINPGIYFIKGSFKNGGFFMEKISVSLDF